MKLLKSGMPVLVLMGTIIGTISVAVSWLHSDINGLRTEMSEIRSDIRSFHQRWDGINTAQNDLGNRVLRLEIEGEN